MLTVQELIKSDENFENNYKNKQFSIDNDKRNGIEANYWVSIFNGITKVNGFQFGSIDSSKKASIRKSAKYCVAFDHKGKAFDNNDNEKCEGYFSNCISFNNGINYQLPYTFADWFNNWSWNAKFSDQSIWNKL